MPDTIVIGNSRPLAPWMVRMRTASSSVSGSTVSTTRAPSLPWRSAQARKSRRLPPSASENGAGLVDHEAHAPPQVARSAVGEADLEHAPLAHDAVEQLAGRRASRRASCHPASARIASPTGWSGGSDSGRRRLVVPVAAVLDLEREEVVVAAPEQRRAQRGHERELVGGVVDRLQHDEQVADLAGAVDERRRLGPVRDAGGVERVLELAERRARRQQDADVAQATRLARARCPSASRRDTGQPSRERAPR